MTAIIVDLHGPILRFPAHISLLFLGLFLTARLGAQEQVGLGDSETIVIYGDSITQQNLYAAYLETFLTSRFPAKALTFYNFGGNGDNANNGAVRFPRDVVPVKPSMVFVNYGMNDGGYRAPDDGVRAYYIAGQRKLAGLIKQADAREVLLTTSPIDNDKRQDLGDMYNDTLAKMADAVISLGSELNVPVIDQFHPLRLLQRDIKASHPGYTMIPDAIHPNEIGHLAMLYEILHGIDVPRQIGSATIIGDHFTSRGGVMINDLKRDTSGVSFTLKLPFIPFFVPEAARPALDLIPFAKEFNTLALAIDGLQASTDYTLSVDGVGVAQLNGERLGHGVDMSGWDQATWSRQGRQLWEISQRRWQRHFDAWRSLGIEADDIAKLPSFAALHDAEYSCVRACSADMRTISQPKPYRISIQRTLAMTHIALSPLYPRDGVFTHRYPPETEPEKVAWKTVDLPSTGLLDLLTIFPGATNCAVYARYILQAEAACTLRFALGSDDGIEVLIDGRNILANDVARALHARDDVVEAPITAGPHVVLMRITQGTGGFGLGVSIEVLGDAVVTEK